MSIDKVVSGRSVAPEHVDAVLELAWLVAGADGRFDGAELKAFRQLAKRLGARAEAAELDALLDRFSANIEHRDPLVRVNELAKGLPLDVRELAFEVVVAMGIVDLDTSRDEMEFEERVTEALGIGHARADELTSKVYEAFNAG